MSLSTIDLVAVPEAGHEPIVLDCEVLLGHEHEAVIRRALLLGDEDLQILPVGEVDAAGEAPATVEQEAAVDVAAGAALERNDEAASAAGSGPRRRPVLWGDACR